MEQKRELNQRKKDGRTKQALGHLSQFHATNQRRRNHQPWAHRARESSAEESQARDGTWRKTEAQNALGISQTPCARPEPRKSPRDREKRWMHNTLPKDECSPFPSGSLTNSPLASSARTQKRKSMEKKNAAACGEPGWPQTLTSISTAYHRPGIPGGLGYTNCALPLIFDPTLQYMGVSA